MSRLTGGLTELGVRRPILITVMNLLIIIAGFAAIIGVDVRELPNIDRPVVSVRGNLQGASPETMDTEVTSIIEAAISRVEGIKTIESSSEENNFRIRAEFDTDIDLNIAANDVREAVNRARREIPDDVEEIYVVKADDDASAIIQLSAVSNEISKEELVKRVEKDIIPSLLAVSGVADVRLNGDQQRVLRIRIDPLKMAAYKMSVSEVVDVLRSANLDVPAGSYESIDQELLVRANASVFDPDKIGSLHIRPEIRLSDVAIVFYGQEDAESYSRLNGSVVVGLGIIRQAGSNTINISEEVSEQIELMNEKIRDFEIIKSSDEAVFIQGAINEVTKTLIIAILVVIIVIAVFLGQARATIIPAVTMPIALIGTVAAIWLMGFSINLITLLALVLATGLIVDDAIVVLENIQRRRGQGIGKAAAAVVGTRQVFFAVVATTVTLISVFLPIAFLPGQTGQLFKEFGLVLSVAVAISSLVAVSLCPMLASKLPGIREKQGLMKKVNDHLEGTGHRIVQFYFRTLEYCLKSIFASLIIAVSIAAVGIVVFLNLNNELLPQEDRGEIRIMVTGPDGAGLKFSDRQAEKVEQILYPYQQQGKIKDVFTAVGQWDKNRALITATMKPWDERSYSQQELLDELKAKISQIPGVQVRIFGGGGLSGGNNSGGSLEVALVGNNYTEINTAAEAFAKILESSIEQIEDIRIEFDTSQPEISFNIDREKTNDLGVPIDDIAEALRVYVDGYDIGDFSVDDESIPVILGSTEGSIQNPDDLLNIFIPTQDGKLIPLASLVTIKESGVAAELDRHSQRRAIELNITYADDIALGNLMDGVRQLANENLASGIGIIFLGEAATLDETSYEVALTFVFALLIVFLVLAAQFESFVSSAIVMFIVPFGIATASLALLISGQSINIYSQIGLVLLIGLITKNSILLVEFMDQLREEGMEIKQAILEATRIRIKPVAMTVISTLMGSVPLILSTGPGSEAREAIGWVVFGGLGFSTIFTLYLTPIAYLMFAPYAKSRSHGSENLERELEEAEKSEER